MSRVLSGEPRIQPDPSADTRLAGDTVNGFGTALLTAVAGQAAADANVVVSPLSVVIALAMLEPGAVGSAQEQLRARLRMDDPAAFHASMNALSHDLGRRAAVDLRIANAAYVQQGKPFRTDYLHTVGT